MIDPIALTCPKQALSVGFNMSISLHVATQAIRLRRSGTSLNTLRVTLWIATAIHLDTLNSRVGSWRGSGFNDADVSSLPPIIPYGGFSPVRLEEEVPVSQMQPSPTVPWLKCDHIHHGPSRFTALFALFL